MSTDLYKERIEVSLDGRQIFYMFVGGAVLSCLVFVLGVMVGKRVESRSHLVAQQADARRDPLAALDRVSEASESLSFRQALRDQQRVAPAVDAEVARAASAATTAATTAAKPVSTTALPAATLPPVAQAPTAVAAAAIAASPAQTAPAKPTIAAAKPQTTAATPEASTGKRFHTLRVSSFKDAAEADALIKQLKGRGYQPFSMPATVDGEAWIRVCIGRHPTYEAAVAAKLKYEANMRKIAYVLTVEP
ncbi:MAG: SPOR domain-containing protein [Myxococcales bacterium]|nr:SPOR domain-containing protein [Myxococcales bacterium]